MGENKKIQKKKKTQTSAQTSQGEELHFYTGSYVNRHNIHGYIHRDSVCTVKDGIRIRKCMY